MDDEYEKERQENIRKNQELLLSLGLNASNGANGPVRSHRRQADAGEKNQEDGTFSPSRTSSRLSSRPRRMYGPSKPTQVAREPVVRAGTRRSARISQNGDSSKRARRSGSDEGEGEDRIEPLSRQRPAPSMLKRLRNPLPPPSVSYEAEVEQEYSRAPLPSRDGNGNIIFEQNNRHFQPNLTPEEMLRGGIFGGTAFRPFYSTVIRQQLSAEDDLREFPSEWYEGLDRKTQLMSGEYDVQMNRFGVKAGQTLEEWESSGWVRRQDPRGWWQWYFRFYLGRRTSDDARQISRFYKACGPNGRFKRALVTKIHSAGTTFDDETISPVIRQTLFHWGYALNQVDYEAYLP